MEVQTKVKSDKMVMDSLLIPTRFSSVALLLNQAGQLSDQLIKKGYLLHELSGPEKVNDSTFSYQLTLHTQIKKARLSTQKATTLQQLGLVGNDEIQIRFDAIEPFLNTLTQQLEVKGLGTAKLYLDAFSVQGEILHAQLKEEITAVRKIDQILVLGYNKFPKGYLKELNRINRKRLFNQQVVKEVFNQVDRISFVSQSKAPEVFFSQDSTKLFLYLEKTKANNFDGYLGFANQDEDKVRFSGYLDLLLHNALNSGEQVKLYWKSDGQEQQSFDFSAQVPYAFGSPLALRGNLHIFQQDSTFQRTTTSIELGYYLRFNSRLFLGYQTQSANDIQGVGSAQLEDLKSKFYTGAWEYTVMDRSSLLFPEKYSINFKSGIGSKSTYTQDQSQYFTQLEAFANINLNPRNLIFAKIQGYHLNSADYQINELYRFGGINSIRGFQENMLQASTYLGLMSEYRFVLSDNLYVNTITDVGYYHDGSMQTSQNVLGLGFGLGLYTNGGIFKLVYANGSHKNQSIELANSIVHLSYKLSF